MFYKKEAFSAVALLFITFASQFFIGYFWGTYQYCTYQTNYLEKHFPREAVYWMTFNINNQEKMPEIKKELCKMDGIEAVLYTESFFLQPSQKLPIFMYTEKMWKYTPITKSKQFYTIGIGSENDIPECILLGEAYADNKVGDIIELPLEKGMLACVVSETVSTSQIHL